MNQTTFLFIEQINGSSLISTNKFAKICQTRNKVPKLVKLVLKVPKLVKLTFAQVPNVIIPV